MQKVSSSHAPQHAKSYLDELAQELAELGVDYVGHGVISPDGHHTGYFSNDQWGDKYIAEGYFFKEPILDSFDTASINIVDWANVDKLSKISVLRNKENNLKTGVTIETSYQGYREFLNLGFSKPKPEFSAMMRLIDQYTHLFRKGHTALRAGKIH
ncbi:MAG: hypothetical protein ACPGXY_06560 [Alphaproteobacteria bacterium]